MKYLSLRQHRRRPVLISTIAVMAFALAACGSSGSNNSSSSSSGTIQIGLGSIVIPGLYDSKVQFKAGIAAAEGYISENGGWGGRSVELVECSSPGDPASDLKCYKQFIDRNVVAVLGLLGNSATYLPKLVDAKIPSFVLPGTPAELKSPWTVTPGGSIETYTAAAHYACAKGLKNIAVFQQDLPQARTAGGAFAKGIFSACGIQVNNVYMPYGTADPAPYIQRAVKSNPELLFIAGQALSISAFLKAIPASGFPMDKVLTVPTAAPNWLQDPKATGIRVMGRSAYPEPSSPDPDVQTFLRSMQKYSPGADPMGELVFPAFSDIVTIWETAKATGFDKLSGQAIYDYMNNVAPGKLKIFGGNGTVVIPPEYVGVRNPYRRIQQWTGSKMIDEGWFAAAWTCTSASTCADLTPPPGSKP